MSTNQPRISLGEVLFVAIIVGIIAMIAIPNILASRRAWNEGAAQRALRHIVSAQDTYFQMNGEREYADLDTLKREGRLPSDFGTDVTNRGYTIVIHPVARAPFQPARFWATAMPTAPDGIGATGTRRFAITEDGMIRADSNVHTAPATYADAKVMLALPQ